MTDLPTVASQDPAAEGWACRAILAPLDGSRLAEATVPVAVALGQRLGATVTLLHVLEHDPPAKVHGEPHLATEAAAMAYLSALAGRVQAAGVSVQIHVHGNPENDVAQSLAAHADELGADLVVLAAHGKGGLRGFLFGSIAQQVVRRGARPVLVVQAPTVDERGRPFAPRTMAVLLNGTVEAAVALPVAIALARPFGAALHLMFAVPTVGTLGTEQAPTATLVPSATRAILDLQERQALDYLRGVAGELDVTAPPTTTAVVRGEPAAALVSEAERVGADLLVLATHGRGGLGGVWAGSVGAKVLKRFSRPLLLVRAPD